MAVTATVLTIAAATLGPVIAATEPADEAATVRTGKPILTMTGSNSGVTHMQYRLAGSQDAFDQLWLAHLGNNPPRDPTGAVSTPQIDFETVHAIFIFGGDRTNTSGYTIGPLEYEDDAITIRFSANSFQHAATGGQDPGVPTRPWALVLSPATGKTVYLMERHLSKQPQVPTWTQRAVFPGRIGIGRSVKGTRQTGPAPRQP